MKNARSVYQERHSEASSKDIDIFEKTRERKKHDYVNAQMVREKTSKKKCQHIPKEIIADNILLAHAILNQK